MTRPALLGIDLGTSGVKVVVVAGDTADDTTALAEASAEYPVARPRPGWAETDPGLWWAAVVTAVRAALAAAGPTRVAALGIDGQMHGLVLADGSGVPVRPALLWADRRAVVETRRWQTLSDSARAGLANPIAPGMTGPMWCWVAKHEPDVAQRARWALLPKDWIRQRLTGVPATEPSDASATLLWDIPEDRWAYEVVDAVGLDAALLPPLLGSGQPAGALSSPSAAELDLPAGIPVATGAGDTPAAFLATGLTDPAEMQVTVGTGAQVVRPLARPEAASRPVTHVYRSAEPTGWYAMAAVQNAGLALDWVRGVLAASWDELYAAVHAGPPGAGGVTFVPYLTGERSPVLADSARGALFGLDLAADRRTVLQAAVEGVAFAVRHAFEALPGTPPPRVRLAGGGTLSPAFRGLLADVLGVQLDPVEVRSASAIGAALLAARAAGILAPPVAVIRAEPVRPSHQAPAYDEPYGVYVRHALSLAAA
jgi:xylulokinase